MNESNQDNIKQSTQFTTWNENQNVTRIIKIISEFSRMDVGLKLNNVKLDC